jgi:beta-glucosidase
VTLFHYTHPLWFHDKTPWTSTASVERFRRFTAHVAKALGDSVRFWIPLNEPLVFLLAGWFDGQIPPGIADAGSLRRVFDHLLAAHAAAAAAIREHVPGAAIGIAHNMMAFAPERRTNFLDSMLAGVAHRCYNRSLIEAFATGRWDFVLPPATRIRGRRDDLPRSLDVFGVNFYSRLHLRCPGTKRFIGEFAYRDASGAGLTDNGWEIIPEAFPALLQEAASAGFPLVVSENGLADANDRLRSRFLETHMDAINRSGVPVHGYFHWSLLDNYEWLDGFGPKFGLYAVDRTTMQRTPRPSIETFRALGDAFLRNPTLI